MQSLLRRFDTNGDKQLNVDEFSSLLSRVLGEVGGGGSSTGLGSLAMAAKAGRAPEMAGFDDGNMARATTPKYLFARIARQFSLDGIHDRDNAEQLLKQMMPEFQRAGLNVLEVATDKIKIRHEDGSLRWIDVVRGVGGGNPAWQWLDETT
ncbi:MAG TPA: hypothetical protein VEA16_07135 [Vicinamibacterales bacterium]|nr:hypothetical protein [Vicinamibacterales bacterium]